MENHVISNIEDLKKDAAKSCIRANRNININIVADLKLLINNSIVEAIESASLFWRKQSSRSKKKWPEIRSTYPKVKLHI